MIVFITLAVLAAIVAFYAFVFFAIDKKSVGMGLVVVSILMVSAGSILWPISECWLDKYRAEHARAKAQSEAEAAQIMIHELGSADSYIDYLTAKGSQK
jgi:hypothetical protein